MNGINRDKTIMANRILFFVHYDKHNNVLGNIYYLLRSVRHMYSRMVFISNSPVSDDDLIKLENHCEIVIVRENKGFDFGAWREGLLKEGWEKLSQYDSVTIMNDSCIGPIFDLREVYAKMEQSDVDFWGLTLWQETKDGMLGTNGSIPEPIQNYFLCFCKRVVQESIFQKFWENVKDKKSVIGVIQCYEAQLIMLLSNHGFKYGSLYAPSRNEHNQDELYRPDLILKSKVPFLKKKSLTAFPYPEHIIDLVKSETNYPVDLIHEWANETLNPNLSLRICDKLVSAVPHGSAVHDTFSVAIHLHVFYLDVFGSMLKHFETIDIKFDLYITTDTIDKKDKIHDYCRDRQINDCLRDIFVFENRGRDILPWLSISDTLGRYDIVGKFHAKKAILNEGWEGTTWLQDSLELLLAPASRIVGEFANNPKMGIIIPDLSTWIRVKPGVIVGNDFKNNPKINELWKRMGCCKEIDFKNLDMVIAPFGSMFWYRPAALQSLLKLGLGASDFPKEPIGYDFTMAHSVEHIPVYCAWNDGFDYRIMVFSPPKMSSFVDHIRLAREVGPIKRNSRTYRVMLLMHSIARKTGVLSLLRVLLAIRRKLLGKRRVK